jgi:hypothetical protein
VTLELIVAALATWEIIEIWHHSLLFAPLRSRVELWENKVGELLGCPFCLSPWIALLSVVVLFIPEWIGWSIWPGLKAVWYAFAVARLANLGNDYFHDKSRTPTPYGDLFAGDKEENE